MKNPVLIPVLTLYIINSVRAIRFNLGYTQREISRILHPYSDNNLLGSIESNFRAHAYTDANLNKLATVFTARAKALGQENIYTLDDFYPAKPIEEQLIPKEVIEFPKGLKQTGILHLLLIEKREKFFDEWHSATEIAQFCGFYAEKNWQGKDYTSVIKVAVDDNKLIRESETEALYKRP